MTESRYRFEKLTPVDKADLSVYEDAINFVFENPDIRNVAISGAYSAGKSSILASYKKNHENLRFLSISLAHFKAQEKEDEEIKESVLEGKILNQLIHQIPSDKIPQTNFRVKRKVDKKSIWKRTALAFLFLLLALYVTFFSLWEAYIRILPPGWLKSLLELSAGPYSPFAAGLGLALISCVLIYHLVKIQKNRNIFRKFNLQGNEIEIFEETDDSYFDKYLNEVLYLFENSDADVIVFEDMDRFNVNRIFERLREVNTLVNIQLKKDEKNPLRFFYLLRDDIFVSKDRTKFFDYIIPVVPVVDSSNSYDKLIELFKQNNLIEKFEAGFLHGLSLYIDDMRILKNIYNEFLIYYNRLNTIELDYNKMLAIIAYKNLFPRDFSDLQLNRGFVAALFASKGSLALAETESLGRQISEKRNIIHEAEQENLLSLKELDTVFDAKRKIEWGRKQPLEKADQEKYEKRKQAIENRTGNKLATLEKELLEMEKSLASLQSRQLRELLTRENINSAFGVTSTDEMGKEENYGEIKSSEYFSLLKYLIRNGYIDETYSDYMTYFYENSLSRNDKSFLISITDKKAKEYDYLLKDPQLVASRLRPVDFEQEETLNFDLLSYLLATPSLGKCLKCLIEQLKRNERLEFIMEYLERGPAIPAFVRQLNIQWPGIFNTMLKAEGLTGVQIRRYSILTLNYSDDNDVEAVNQDNCLCEYISSSPDYLAIENPDTERLIHGFRFLGVRFSRIDYDHAHKGLFMAVYENSLYEINFDNISLILRVVFHVNGREEIRHKNYTLITSEPATPLAAYVHENMEQYMSQYLGACKEIILDDERAVLQILNNKSVPEDQKNSYINSLKTPVTSITSVEVSSLWAGILDAHMAAYTEENILEYYSALKSMDNSLMGFMNSRQEALDFTKVASTYGDDKMKNLFDGIVICNGLKNRKYRECVTSLNYRFEDFNISGISDEKIKILITGGIVRMNEKTLAFFRKNYRSQLYPFIRKYMEEYVRLMHVGGFSFEELIEILSWRISDELKISLLELTSKEISIHGKNYSTNVCLHVLNHNFKKSDQSHLFADYEKYEDALKDTIFGLALTETQAIIKNPKAVAGRLKRRLLRSKELGRETKLELFTAMLPDLRETEVKYLLDVLKLTEYLKIFDTRSRPKFTADRTNEKLLSVFKERQWIEDYVFDPARDGYYKIIRRRGKAR